MGYSDAASLIFAIRNADKTSNGEIGRLIPTVGQSCSVVKAVSRYGNPVSRCVKRTLNTLGSDEVARKLGKVANFASNHVNDFIVLSSGIKVATAKKEDRRNVLIAEAGCLAGMFLGEGWMKKNLAKYLDQLTVNKKWIPLIKGIVFVTGSISCSTIGQKIGKKIAQYWDKPLAAPKENENTKKPYEPLNIKA